MKTIVCALPLALLLAGCGGPETSAPTPPEKAVVADKPVVKLTPEQRGAKLFKRCQACHTLDEGGRHKVGPNLWDIYGSKTASKEGFAYSKAMKAADIVWDNASMDAYLKKPAAYLPGTKMSFIGLKKQEDRDATQAYLKSKTTP